MKTFKPKKGESTEALIKRAQRAIPGMILDDIHKIVECDDETQKRIVKNLEPLVLELLIKEAKEHYYSGLAKIAQEQLNSLKP